MDAEWFAKAKPASEVLPPQIYAALVAQRPRGRPKADETKVFTAIRLDADLLEEHEAKVKALQDALRAGLESGEPRTFDLSCPLAKGQKLGLSAPVVHRIADRLLPLHEAGVRYRLQGGSSITDWPRPE